MKKIVVPFLVAAGLLFVGQQDVGAKDLTEIKSKRGFNSIQLETENLKGNYIKVYRDGEKVWEGNKKEYVDANLEPDYSYTYKIGVYDNEKLVDIVSHRAKTKKEKPTKEEKADTTYSEETDLVSTVGKDFVTLEWETIPDDDGIYEIYRDGKLLDQVSTTTYTDSTVNNGQDYLYEIVSSKEVSNKQKKEIKKQLKENDIDYSKIDKEYLFNEVKTVGKVVETVEEISEAELATIDVPEEFVEAPIQTLGIPDVGAEVPAYIFRYQTFIPFASVDNPNQLHETLIGKYGTRLKGDNRGYDPFSNKYRTRVDVFADWWYPDLYADRLVGESVLYDSSGNVLMRDTESNSGIKVTKDLVSSTKMMWRVNHDVGIPFHSSYPNITYYYEGTVYKNGTFSLRGSHDKAPNHELYAGNAYTDIRPLTAYTYAVGSTLDFGYLAPGTPQKYFEVSM
ncbi:DUF3238 domain-containing protein [Mesobacillus maritimus]|uniref:DUF3238 domain-containing protein n=1 Tax=Mesobacillus maritimus TaxID=1643336 RepID=UPI00203DB7C9|nr:DUF3238 domain-containing protein [Mesobacillus maritimus]MCM3670926.1 DUF3238 domain-containing protein [Mesobacillus maritimus]